MKVAAPLRIMEVVQSLEKGGRTVRFHDTITALTDNGHQVIAVCFGPFDKPSQAAQNLTLQKGSGKQLGLIWQLIRLIQKYKIQLVHAHCESSQLYAGIAAKLCRIPAVGTFHRSRLECYQPSFSNRLIRGALSHYVAVSEDRLALLTTAMQLPAAQCSVVHGGTRMLSQPSRSKHEARQQLALPADTLILLSIGHLGEIKGHQDTLRALAILKRSDVTLYIAGSGSAQEQQHLSALTEQLHLTQQVVFLGQIADATLWLDACDVFVQPSHEEAFGLVFIEAGARYRPVVATAVGGIKEIIQHEKTGLLAAPCAPEQLAAHLDRLLASPALCQQYGEAAYRRVAQQFSLPAMLGRYLTIFNQLTH